MPFRDLSWWLGRIRGSSVSSGNVGVSGLWAASRLSRCRKGHPEEAQGGLANHGPGFALAIAQQRRRRPGRLLWYRSWLKSSLANHGSRNRCYRGSSVVSERRRQAFRRDRRQVRAMFPPSSKNIGMVLSLQEAKQRTVCLQLAQGCMQSSTARGHLPRGGSGCNLQGLKRNFHFDEERHRRNRKLGPCHSVEQLSFPSDLAGRQLKDLRDASDQMKINTSV
jgi:hypothetical protein